MISDQRLYDLYHLKNLIRYNNKNRIKNENVAEHSYFVAIISLEICNKLELNEEITYKCLIKSLLHDLPEMELNDITHDVKTKLHLDELMEQYEKAYYINNFSKQSDIMNNYQPLVDEIVKLADIYSVKQFCINETALGNNTEDIKEIIKNTLLRLTNAKKLLDKKYKEINE